MNNVIIKIKSQPLLAKSLFTLVIIFVYLLGRYLPVPILGTKNDTVLDSATGQLLKNLSSITGGELTTLTLFSLGLSPYMTAMILWRFVTLFDWLKHFTMAQTYRRRLTVMLVVAIIQAFGVSQMYLETGSSTLVIRMAIMLIMISGAFVLMWLGDKNTQYGLGGPSVIIITNLILNFLTNLTEFLSEQKVISLTFLGHLFLFLLILNALIVITIISYRSEYRIPIRRITVNTSYNEKNYLPIRLNPAGGMPFMYGIVLMMLPPFIIQGLLSIYPKNVWLHYFENHLSLSTWFGVMVYALILYSLTLGFTYYNYDPFMIAKNMRQSGDYIENILPGKPTERYIRHYLAILGQIGAIFICFIGVGPLIWLIGQGDKTNLALLISNVFIVTSLMLGVVEQVQMLRLWKNYGNLL